MVLKRERGKSAHSLLLRDCLVILNLFLVPSTTKLACSRRDDPESVALLLLHILTPGGLPWTRNGIPRNEGAHDRLKQKKRAALLEDLASGLGEFEEFLRYCRSLGFMDQPDYAHWREHLYDLADETRVQKRGPIYLATTSSTCGEHSSWASVKVTVESERRVATHKSPAKAAVSPKSTDGSIVEGPATGLGGIEFQQRKLREGVIFL